MINTVPFQYKDNFKTCLSFDPAIDKDHPQTNLVEFVKTRDLSHVQFKPGQEPTWFYFNYLDYFVMTNYIGKAENKSQEFFLCFKYGLSKVENLKAFCIGPKIEKNNLPIPIWLPSQTSKTYDGSGFVHASDKEVYDLFNGPSITELGIAVWQKNFLPGQ